MVSVHARCPPYLSHACQALKDTPWCVAFVFGTLTGEKGLPLHSRRLFLALGRVLPLRRIFMFIIKYIYIYLY